MSKPTYEDLQAALKELRRRAFSARRNSHTCGDMRLNTNASNLLSIEG